MRKSSFLIITLIVTVALLVAACGGTEAAAPEKPKTAQESANAPAADSAAAPVTLRVLIHQNPPMVEYMNTFNEKFQKKYPNITVDMSVVNANDLSTVSQTRLTANDVDVVDMFGFANAAQPYMKKVDPPNWQTLIEAG